MTFFDAATLLIATSALLISALSYFQNRRRQILLDEQQREMNSLATRLLILHDQMKTVASTKVKGSRIDPYLFPSMRRNAERVEISLDKAMSLGLWKHIFGNKEYSILLHTAFIQGLGDAYQPDSNQNQFTKQHLVFGIIRALNSCKDYLLSHNPDLAAAIDSAIDPELLEISRTYLKETSINEIKA